MRIETWKRLTFAVVLSFVVVALITPATPAGAIAVPRACTTNQSTIIVYYSDSAKTHPICQDVLYACPGFSPTHFCDGSKTPYYTTYCNDCGLN
jgi:hypothetical protein